MAEREHTRACPVGGSSDNDSWRFCWVYWKNTGFGIWQMWLVVPVPLFNSLKVLLNVYHLPYRGILRLNEGRCTQHVVQGLTLSPEERKSSQLRVRLKAPGGGRGGQDSQCCSEERPCSRPPLPGLFHKLKGSGTSLVVQWLRIRLPMQGSRVQALVRQDPTCRGATKPVRHNYWACTLEPTSHNYWACMLQLLKPMRLEPVLRSKRSHHSEKPTHRNEE